MGNRRPLGKGASGRLLFAHAPDNVRRAVADAGGGLPNDEELSHILEQGYAETNGELTTGVWAIAVPLTGPDGNCTTCLSISVPSARRTDAYRGELIAALTRTADAIGAAHTLTKLKKS